MLTSEQLIARKSYIGGSDVGIIVGASSFMTPLELYKQKKSNIIKVEAQTEQQYWGDRLEPVIRAEFASRHNVEVAQPDTRFHPFYKMLAANVDGYIEKTNEILEVKTVNAFAFTNGAWGEEGTCDIPAAYKCQVAHYCNIYDADRARIAVLVGGNNYREYVYERDIAFEQELQRACLQFWQDMQDEVEPPANNIHDLKLLHPEAKEKNTIKACDFAKCSLTKLADIKSQLKQLKEQEENTKFELIGYMKDAEILEDEDGQLLATYKNTKRGRSLLLK